MISFLIFLAKRVGDLAGICSKFQSWLGRRQTEILTAAQHRGWKPATTEEVDILARRQYRLFEFKMTKAMEKKQRKGQWQ